MTVLERKGKKALKRKRIESKLVYKRNEIPSHDRYRIRAKKEQEDEITEDFRGHSDKPRLEFLKNGAEDVRKTQRTNRKSDRANVYRIFT